MKLEFVENGSPDCPLIRLYEFDSPQAVRLREIIVSLSDGTCDWVALHKDPTIEPVGGCELTLRVSGQDLGIIRRKDCGFDCLFTAEGWRDIVSRIEPFCESSAAGSYQWLTERGDAFWLLSPDGSW